MKAQEQMVQQIQQEMKKETQNYKFELELKYQTLIDNKEKEMQKTFATNQSKDLELVQSQQSEI